MEELKKEDNAKKIKNLISAVILLSGLFVGSIFVDVAQLVKGGGFSKKSLNSTDVFEADGKTWVAYQEPGVSVKVVSDENCEACDPSEALVWMRKVMPTVSAERIAYDSEEGIILQEKFGLKSIPAFIFDDKVAETDFYSQAQVLFDQKNDGYLFNIQELGLAPGKFLATPEVQDDDPMLGNKEADTKLIVFSDFQCPYSKIFQSALRANEKNYSDQMTFVFKYLPLSFHTQGNNSALAAECANEQGKFWEYADYLFNRQNAWGATEGTNIFKSYAANLGLNYNQFSQCLDSEKYQAKIDADVAEATSFGISGTPAVFVGDQFKNGAMNADQLKSLIDSELNK